MRVPRKTPMYPAPRAVRGTRRKKGLGISVEIETSY